MDQLDRLLAIEEIKKLKARYFRCVDAQDAEGFANVFTPDGVLDMRFVNEAPNLAGTGPASAASTAVLEGRAAIVKAVKAVRGLWISAHHGHMPEIEFESDNRATGIWSMEDFVVNVPGTPEFKIHGRGLYHETYERLQTGWHIKYSKLTRLHLQLG